MYPRIRALREDSDLNQTELAALLGMSQTGYSKYETGENDVPTAILQKLAAMYNTNIDYLLGMTDHKSPLLRTSKFSSRCTYYRNAYLRAVEEKRMRRGISDKKET